MYTGNVFTNIIQLYEYVYSNMLHFNVTDWKVCLGIYEIIYVCRLSVLLAQRCLVFNT